MCILHPAAILKVGSGYENKDFHIESTRSSCFTTVLINFMRSEVHLYLIYIIYHSKWNSEQISLWVHLACHSWCFSCHHRHHLEVQICILFHWFMEIPSASKSCLCQTSWIPQFTSHIIPVLHTCQSSRCRTLCQGVHGYAPLSPTNLKNENAYL